MTGKVKKTLIHPKTNRVIDDITTFRTFKDAVKENKDLKSGDILCVYDQLIPTFIMVGEIDETNSEATTIFYVEQDKDSKSEGFVHKKTLKEFVDECYISKKRPNFVWLPLFKDGNQERYAIASGLKDLIRTDDFEIGAVQKVLTELSLQKIKVRFDEEVCNTEHYATNWRYRGYSWSSQWAWPFNVPLVVNGGPGFFRKDFVTDTKAMSYDECIKDAGTIGVSNPLTRNISFKDISRFGEYDEVKETIKAGDMLEIYRWNYSQYILVTKVTNSDDIECSWTKENETEKLNCVLEQECLPKGKNIFCPIVICNDETAKKIKALAGK